MSLAATITYNPASPPPITSEKLRGSEKYIFAGRTKSKTSNKTKQKQNIYIFLAVVECFFYKNKYDMIRNPREE